MSWVVYYISLIIVVVGAQLVRHDEPIWGGILLGLGIVVARASGVMHEHKRSNQ